MAWEQRGTKAYFYLSRRAGTRVTREFLGSGARACEASDGIERRRTQRAADAQAVRDAEQRHEKSTALLDLFCRITDLAMRAVLSRHGFHQHCRHWRKRRVTDHA